jgi:hypothetical protein
MTKHDILLIGDAPDFLKTIGWVLDYKGFAVKVTASPVQVRGIPQDAYAIQIGDQFSVRTELSGGPNPPW